MIRRYPFLGAALLALSTGCAAPRTGVLPDPRPRAGSIPAFGGQRAKTPEADPATLADPQGALALRDALALTLTRNPELKAFSYEVRAAEARALQAGLRPNPELELELEEFDRNGEGMDSSELVIGLGQAIELGGKRRLRKRIATTEGELAGWDYEEARLAVLTETARRFTTAVAAEQKLRLAKSAAELAGKLSATVDAHVAAGKEPRFQSSRAAAELGLAQLDVLEARNEVTTSRRKLANMWAARKATFTDLKGAIDQLADDLPPLAAVESYLPQNPRIARQDAELRLVRASLAAERAARTPDLDVSVSFIQFEEDGTDALAFGIALPLPLFDRNQGGIAAAKHDLAKVSAELRAAHTDLSTELAEAYAALTTAHTRVRTLRGKVLPASEKAASAAVEGYKQGKFAYVDVLDAQRSLFEVRIEVLEALTDYHDALLSIEQLTATSLNKMHEKNKENQQ